MNHPRYRLKTLLIATTILAVVVACLAPWLRLVTGSQVARLALGMLCVTLGAGLGWLAMLIAYRRMYALRVSSIPSYHLKSIRIRPNRWTTIGLMSLFLFVALFDSFSMPPSSMLSFSGCLLFATGGFWLNRAFPQPFLLQGDVLLADTWLLHPYQILQLQIYYSYRWRDRESGILEVTAPFMCKLELLVRPEDIEAVDTLLSKTLITQGR